MQRRDAAVHLRALAAQAHLGVHGEREVDGRRPRGQPLHVALRREHEDLVLVEIDLQELEELLGAVGVLLQLEKLAEPLEARVQLVAQLLLLVHPVRRDAELRGAVHLAGADLDLVDLAAGTEYRGVQRLVAVGLGRRYVVLDPLLERRPVVVDQPQGVVAVRHRVHQDPERHQVIDLFERPVTLPHLPVDGPQVLGPAGQLVVLDACVAQRLLDRRPQPLDHLLALCPLRLDLLGQRPVLVVLQELEREVLQLALDPGHPEAVCEGRIDLARLERDGALPFRRQVLERAHVVQPVGQLHDDHARVAGDRQQQLAVVLRLLLCGRAEGEARNLGEPVHDVGDLDPEVLADLLQRDVRVLGHVVQQRRRNRDRVHLLQDQDLRDRHGVGDEVLSREALLPVVRRGARLERALHERQVEPILVLGQSLGELCVHRLKRARHCPRASRRQDVPTPAARGTGTPAPVTGFT